MVSAEEQQRLSAMGDAVADAWFEGRHDEAIQLGEQWWSTVTERDTGWVPQGALFIARAAARAGRPDVARDPWVPRAYQAYGGDQITDGARVMVQFVDAVVAYHEGQLDRAFELFKGCYDFGKQRVFDLPRDEEYWEFFRERAGLPKKQKKASQRDLKKLAAEGDELQEAGDLDGAIAVWESATLQLGPNPLEHPMAFWFHASLADAQFQNGDYEAAVDSANQALLTGVTDNAFPWLRLGQARFELGQKDGAADALASAFMLGGDEIFEDEDPKYQELITQRGVR